MQNVKKRFIGAFLPLLIAFVGGTARAATIAYSENIAGTHTPTSTDSNEDGIGAQLVIFDGKANSKALTGQGMYEFEFADAVTACPADNVQLNLVTAGSVRTFGNGDQLFLQATSGVVCYDSETNTATLSVSGNFTGGVGKYAGASGSWTGSGTGHYLGFYFLGAFTGHTSGTIVTP